MNFRMEKVPDLTTLTSRHKLGKEKMVEGDYLVEATTMEGKLYMWEMKNKAGNNDWIHMEG